MMGVSPYIDRLVAREKRQRAAFRDTTLERIIEWHQKRLGELDSAIAGPRCENAKTVKARHARQMHEMTIFYLKKVQEK
jgi:hypothetical protein